MLVIPLPGDVRFGPVPWAELAREGLVAADMHYHTDHSDSPTTVKSLLKYARKLGAGVAITDHNEVSGSVQALEEAEGVMVVPGIEISAADGPHILVYYRDKQSMVEHYKKHVQPFKGPSPYLAIRMGTQEIAQRAEPYGTVVSAAHPYGYLMMNKGVGKCIDTGWLDRGVMGALQAVEVISGGLARGLNVKAARLADEWGKGRTAGSDGHLLGDLGTVAVVGSSPDPDAFLDEILARRTAAVGMEKTSMRKAVMGTAVMARHMPYAVPSMYVHYQQNMPRVTRAVRRAARRGRRPPSQ